ncbi:MAG: hypothetical protein AAF846_29850 [Chloroflexota bacterium]
MDKRKRKYPIVFRATRSKKIVYSFLLVVWGSVFLTFLNAWYLVLLSVLSGGVSVWIIAGFLLLSLFVFVLLANLYPFINLISRSKLIVTDKGIELIHNHRYFFSWQAMTQLAYHPKAKKVNFAEWGIQAVGAREITHSLIGHLLIGGYSHDKFIPLGYFVEIPMSGCVWSSPDIEKFRETEFGQILCDHAPHLFEDVEKPKKH